MTRIPRMEQLSIIRVIRGFVRLTSEYQVNLID
jgi:hypothetical protein